MMSQVETIDKLASFIDVPANDVAPTLALHDPPTQQWQGVCAIPLLRVCVCVSVTCTT